MAAASKKSRVFPVVGGTAASSSSAAPSAVLALCDKPVEIHDLPDEGEGLVDAVEDTSLLPDLDAALEHLAVFVDTAAPRDPGFEHGEGPGPGPGPGVDPFEDDSAPPDPLFAPPPKKQLFGKEPAAKVGVFPNGRIAFYSTDNRFECTCFCHPNCVLTRSRTNLHSCIGGCPWLMQMTAEPRLTTGGTNI